MSEDRSFFNVGDVVTVHFLSTKSSDYPFGLNDQMIAKHGKQFTIERIDKLDFTRPQFSNRRFSKLCDGYAYKLVGCDWTYNTAMFKEIVEAI